MPAAARFLSNSARIPVAGADPEEALSLGRRAGMSGLEPAVQEIMVQGR